MTGEDRSQNGAAGLSDGSRLADRLAARSIEAALVGLEARWATPRDNQALAIWPTGFAALDEAIGGGIRPGSLTLVAGPPGVGKTTFALQLARNLARSAQVSAVYLCFEHATGDILTRLVAMEDALTGDDYHLPLSLRDVRRFSAGLATPRPGAGSSGSGERRFAAALERVRAYRERLFIVEATMHAATLDAIERTVREVQELSPLPIVVIVDYLQKVRAERVREATDAATIAEGLKNLALRHRLGAVAVSALNEAGLHTANTQLHHLLGGPVLAYEADAVLMLQEKSARISRVGFEYSPQKVANIHDWIIVNLAKNRFGRDLVNLEFQKQFTSSCFVPTGSVVSDVLIDDKLHRE